MKRYLQLMLKKKIKDLLDKYRLYKTKQFLSAIVLNDLGKIKQLIKRFPTICLDAYKVEPGFLSYLVYGQNLEILKVIFSNNAANIIINLPTGKLSLPPPLIVAATQRENHILKLLLDHEANVNIRDSCGNTALHAACMRNNAENIFMLLHYNANTMVINNQGKRAWDLVSIAHRQKVINFVKLFVIQRKHKY